MSRPALADCTGELGGGGGGLGGFAGTLERGGGGGGAPPLRGGGGGTAPMPIIVRLGARAGGAGGRGWGAIPTALAGAASMSANASRPEPPRAASASMRRYSSSRWLSLAISSA